MREMSPCPDTQLQMSELPEGKPRTNTLIYLRFGMRPSIKCYLSSFSMLQGMEVYCTASWLQQSCLKTSLVPQTLGSQAWRRHTEALNVIPSKQGSNAGSKAELLDFHLASVWSLLVSMGKSRHGSSPPSCAAQAELTRNGGLCGRNHVLILTFRGGALGCGA